MRLQKHDLFISKTCADMNSYIYLKPPPSLLIWCSCWRDPSFLAWKTDCLTLNIDQRMASQWWQASNILARSMILQPTALVSPWEQKSSATYISFSQDPSIHCLPKARTHLDMPLNWMRLTNIYGLRGKNNRQEQRALVVDTTIWTKEWFPGFWNKVYLTRSPWKSVQLQITLDLNGWIW